MNRRPRTWQLEIPTERVPGGIVIAPRGRIGSVTAAIFADGLTVALGAAPRVILDLAEVDYLSSAGIRTFQSAVATNGSHITLCGLQDPVRIALTLAGVLGRVVVVKDRHEALELLRD